MGEFCHTSGVKQTSLIVTSTIPLAAPAVTDDASVVVPQDVSSVSGSASATTQGATSVPPAVVPELGGRRDGTDPTRFGDWEKGGRCIDF